MLYWDIAMFGNNEKSLNVDFLEDCFRGYVHAYTPDGN